MHRLPVQWSEPARLRRPLSTDQQHVADLNGIFVQDQNVVGPHRFQFEPAIPGQKWVGFRSRRTQMSRRRPDQMP